MFIRVKISSTEEGMIDRVHYCSAAHHGSDMGTEADRGRSSQCLCWVYTTSTFLIQAVYTAICHATSKTVKTEFIILNTCCQFFFKCIRSIHNWKTRTETIRNEYMYCYPPTIQ